MLRWMVDTTVGALTRRTPVPDDLAAVTVRGDESGRAEEADAVWERVEALYRTGMHPGIQVCISHRGEVVVDRAIGHARGVGPDRPPGADGAVPMTLETPVNLFSASKAVTGMLMHKLEERGCCRSTTGWPITCPASPGTARVRSPCDRC